MKTTTIYVLYVVENILYKYADKFLLVDPIMASISHISFQLYEKCCCTCRPLKTAMNK
jgi:hypothetical protein